jgi:hypothetical protein
MYGKSDMIWIDDPKVERRSQDVTEIETPPKWQLIIFYT